MTVGKVEGQGYRLPALLLFLFSALTIRLILILVYSIHGLCLMKAGKVAGLLDC